MSDQSLTHTEHWLALAHAPALGIACVRALLSGTVDPETLLTARATELDTIGVSPRARKYLASPEWPSVEQDRRWLEKPNHHLLTLQSANYPELLKQIADPPVVLFAVGDLDSLLLPQIAIVGSRNASRNGERTSHEFAAVLARAGLAVTSGLALGIDGAAHRGALEGPGITIAVLGTGPDRIYPAEHSDLAEKIVASGVLLTEYPPHTGVKRAAFPRRNRIIAGMSVGTLVVEAAAKSGSLITARQALEQGREVFAIPGSIHNPLARGCHALIRDGAKLVESVDDIFEELVPLIGALKRRVTVADGEQQVSSAELDEQYQLLLGTFEYEPVAVDILVDRTGLTASEVSSMLLILELDGYVDSQPGGIYIRSSIKGK